MVSKAPHGTVEESYNWLKWMVTVGILAIVYVMVILFCVYIWPLLYLLIAQNEFLETLRSSIEHAATLALIFYLVFESATKASFVEQIKQSLVNVLSAQEKVFEALTDDTKRQFVSNSLKTTVGHGLGSAIYTEIISPYFNESYYRSDLKYIVRAIEGFPEFAKQATDPCKKIVEYFKSSKGNSYLWFDQDLTYKLINAKTDETVEGEYLICITFDQMTMQRLLANQHIFFREVIELDSPLQELVEKLDEAAADDFVRNVLQLRLRKGDGSRGDLYKVKLKRDDTSKFHIEISTTLSGGSKLGLSFNYPRSREAPWFIAALPQTCIRPEIQFSGNTQMTKVEPIYFLSNLRPDNVDPGSGLNITLKGWTFPTSGVMFTWRYRDRGGSSSASRHREVSGASGTGA